MHMHTSSSTCMCTPLQVPVVGVYDEYTAHTTIPGTYSTDVILTPSMTAPLVPSYCTCTSVQLYVEHIFLWDRRRNKAGRVNEEVQRTLVPRASQPTVLVLGVETNSRAMMQQ